MMNEWIISSSILIVAVLLGREILRGKISLRLQYCLWLVVLVRLLLPVQLFTSSFGAGSIARDVDVAEPVRQVYTSAREDDYEREYDAAYQQVVAEYESRNQTYVPADVELEAAAHARESLELDLTKLLYTVWFAGMGVLTAVIVLCNAHFALQLKRRRRAVPEPSSLLPVYVTEAVPTPCLFGLFHPAIYLTAEAAADERIKTHVLSHELTHYRHGDHIWSVLRTVCLILHWYNPLVWLAAKVSRADAELACDEGTLARLGEEHRADYGRTLIGLTCGERPGSAFLTATTMTGSARTITERIRLLMKRPRNTVLALTALILIGSLIIGCSFAGAPDTTEPGETTAPTDETVSAEPEFGTVAYFDDLLNPKLERSDADWYPLALTSFYDDPTGIDLYQLFYTGIPGVNNTPSAGELASLKNSSGYNPEYDLDRLPEVQMNRILRKYFGLTLPDTEGIGLENFIHLDNCYYHCHTDSNLGFCEVTRCEEMEENVWRVWYTPDAGEPGVVTLRWTEDGWQILANQPAEASSIFHSDGLITFPGTEWNMSEEEVLQALDIQEYGVFSGMRGFYLPETTFCGYPVSIALYFDQYTTDTEWGLFSVAVKFKDEADFDAVHAMLMEQLGSPDFQTSGVSFDCWRSDIRVEELVSTAAYEEYLQSRTVSLTQNIHYADGAASTVSCYGPGNPDWENVVCFEGWLTKALQIEANLAGDQADEVAALFGPDADPWYLAALTVQYANQYSFDAESYFCNVQTAVALTDEEEAVIVEHHGKEALEKPIFRMTMGRMDEILREYIGTDTSFVDLSGFLFCPETGAYLKVKEEITDLPTPEILSCEILAQDQVRMIYTLPGSEHRYAATLLKGKNWKVYSNQMLVTPPENARLLTEEEIDRVNAAFEAQIYNEDMGEETVNPICAFFTSCYEDVRDLKLPEFLRYFPISGAATQEEFQSLHTRYGEDFLFSEFTSLSEMPVPVHRYELSYVDKVLRRYADISHDELTGKYTEYYLPETDCYYNFTSDFGPGMFHCAGGWVYDGGATLYSNGTVLTLTEENGTYYIQSHLPALVILG